MRPGVEPLLRHQPFQRARLTVAACTKCGLTAPGGTVRGHDGEPDGFQNNYTPVTPPPAELAAPYYQDDWLTVHEGDARTVLAGLPPKSVHCVVTSPPYWGLRDYGSPGQLGLEATPEAYVAAMVDVFREVRRVLRADGTVWLNLGDSFFGTGRGPTHPTGMHSGAVGAAFPTSGVYNHPVLKGKDLVGIPWRVAFALQADGWYLRSDIVWSKPNPMPESVTDRPTKAHEYVFLLTRSARYFYDAAAVAEPATYSGPNGAQHSPYGQGFTRRSDKQAEQAAAGPRNGHHVAGFNDRWDAAEAARRPAPANPTWEERKAAGAQPGSHGVGQLVGTGTQRTVHGEGLSHDLGDGLRRNLRSVWTIPTAPYPGAHFATFPPALVTPCIKAGCPPDGVVLDPFAGTGTVGLVAQQLSRRAVLIDLNAEYLRQCLERNRQTPLGLPA